MNHRNKKILLLALPPDRVPPGGLEKLKTAARGREVVPTASKRQIEPLLEHVEIGIGEIPFSLIPRMPNLKWVQLWMAGADRLQLYPQVKAHPFLLTNASGMHGRQLTEHIFALLLAWGRGLKRAITAQGKHEWLQLAPPELPVLWGKTMLILGYGTIGKETALAARAFGMNVTGIRRHAPPAVPEEPGNIRVEPPARILELLPQADIVVNILPLTPETADSFGSREFGAMKAGALYMNVGRGATTDEDALIDALREGRIAGALLDVVKKEPLPPDSPLWDMENVIITGHYAGLRENYDDLALEIALDNLGRYLKGEPLRNLVDKNAGY
ncbi:MAG: D-2-hydroxyacid dehydrogenase [Treponema sp.]|jgi:phosphoglycerate dehydrogenase-like enzyme|nr:D-2-hydroxyacid dehydrogenase [Treponema sp.]